MISLKRMSCMVVMGLFLVSGAEAVVLVEVNRHDYENLDFYGIPVLQHEEERGDFWSAGYGWEWPVFQTASVLFPKVA